MTLERSFRLSSLFMTTAGFTGLVLAADIHLGLILLGFSALVISILHAGGWGFTPLANTLSRASTDVWNVLMVVAFLACGIDLLWVSQDLLLAGINFLIVLMVNKLFNLNERKDFLYLYAISFLLLLAAAAMTVEPWYAIVFVAFLLSAIWTLLLYHLRNEAEEHHKGAGPGLLPALNPISPRFFWTTNTIALAALFLTAAIFFVTPRIGAGYFQKDRGQAIRTTGFSQTVDLGVFGSVKLDPTVVMRVELAKEEGQLQDPMYLQGATFDKYNGRTWANSFSRRQAVGRGPDGEFLVSGSDRQGVGNHTLRQEILMEALDTSALFGVPHIHSVKGNFLIVQTDAMGDLHLPYAPARRFQYTVDSVPTTLRQSDRTASSFTYPRHIKEYFLQLPELTPKVAMLVSSITKKATTPYEKTNAIKWHLLGNYRYSLDVGSSASPNPLEEFLFVRKTGYCEHYATAMVVLLRTAGIPARLITGFLATEWNDFGNYYTVRQQDAHAWVEVFFPGSGWVIFDPTPPASASPSTTTAIVGRFLDSLRLKWTRVIIQYSYRDQQAVLQEIREQSEPVRTQTWESLNVALKWFGNWRAWLSTHLSGLDWRTVATWIAGLGLTFFLMRLWSRRRRWIWKPSRQSTPQQVAAARLYGKMLRLLESRGLSKGPSVAPLEFAGHITSQWSDLESVVRPLTELYCRARFGAISPNPQELLGAGHLLVRLRILIRSKSKW